MSEEKKFDVFLSYSRADQRSVIRLAQRLREADISCFMDTWNLGAGVPWQEALVSALNRSRSCAVIFGPTGPGPWTKLESELALQIRQNNTTFRVIPVLLPKADPNAITGFLSTMNRINFKSGLSDKQAFYQLTCAIQGEESDVWKQFGTKDPIGPSLNARASTWERSGQSEQYFLKGKELRNHMSWGLKNSHRLPPLTRTYLDLSLERYLREIEERDARQSAAILAGPKLRLLEGVHEKPSAINTPVVRQSLTALTRLAQRNPSAIQFLDQILEERLEQLGEIAVDVASEAGDPIGLILADKIEKDATQDILSRLLKALRSHQGSVPLREAAVAATRKMLHIHEAVWPRPNSTQKSERARLMEEIGELLSKIGQWNDALTYSERAVALYRELSSEQPMLFSSDLSRSLISLGERLFELGRHDEALTAYQEAIVIERILLGNDDG